MRAAPSIPSRIAAPIALIATVLMAPAARADDPEAARAAYDRGAAAFEAKRYAEAAADLARADALAPNPVALGSALKAADLADDPVLALTLADRIELRPGAGEPLLASARRIREKMAARAGKLSIKCAAARGCAVTVDAEPFPAEQQRWVKAGAHAVEINVGAKAARYTVTVDAGKTLEWIEPGAAPLVEPPKQEPPKQEPPKQEPPKQEPPKQDAPPPSGISPAWFFVGLGLTAVAGGVSIWSGVDTLGQHRDYVDFKVDDPTSGKAAQTRTNILFGVTGGLAVATAAVGIFAVRWSAPPAKQAAIRDLAFSPGPLGGALRARF